MAFFWDQRQRLQRDDNWTANGLAEELWAMFSPEVPNNTEAPVNVTLPKGSSQAPFQIGNFDPGSPIFNLTRPDGSGGGTINFGGTNFTFTQDGKTTVIGGGGGGSGGSVVPVWG